MRCRTLAVLVSVLLAGCATVPDVTFRYHYVTWKTIVTVTHTVGCNADNTRLVAVSAASVQTVYTSDLDKPKELKLTDVGSKVADTDLSLSFFEDGRLRSINQGSTGQGESIVKAAVALGTAMVGIAKKGTLRASYGTASPNLVTFSMEDKDPIEACKEIASRGGSTKTIAITYTATIGPDNDADKPVLLAAASRDVEGLFEAGSLPQFFAQRGGVKSVSTATYAPCCSSDDLVPLRLQRVGVAELSVLEERKGIARQEIGRARILIPTGEDYELAIPKARFFGSQTFKLELSEAGAVTAVGYGAKTGAAGVLNALGAIAASQTAEAEAKELKAQADLIVQQNRLVLCQTKPEDCK